MTLGLYLFLPCMYVHMKCSETHEILYTVNKTLKIVQYSHGVMKQLLPQTFTCSPTILANIRNYNLHSLY
jgi:hypothetical protein